eukprot:2726880-Rhodomonas_salina.2
MSTQTSDSISPIRPVAVAVSVSAVSVSGPGPRLSLSCNQSVCRRHARDRHLRDSSRRWHGAVRARKHRVSWSWAGVQPPEILVEMMKRRQDRENLPSVRHVNTLSRTHRQRLARGHSSRSVRASLIM